MKTLTTNHGRTLSLIFKVQCLLIFTTLTGNLWLNFQNSISDFDGFSTVIILILTALLGFLIPKISQPATNSLLNQITKTVVRLIVTAFFPTAAFASIALLLHPLITQVHLTKMPIIYLAFLMSLINLIPYLKLLSASEPRSITRMMFIFSYLFYFPTAFNQLEILGYDVSDQFNVWITFNPTITLLILAYLFLFASTFYIMIRWGFSLPKLKLNSKVNFGWLILIIAPTLLELTEPARSWQGLLHHLTPHVVSGPITYPIVIIITVCCYEEIIFRYALLWPLFQMNKRPAGFAQMVSGILVSSLLFGFWHFTNLQTNGLTATLLQVASAIGTGFILATICLYTGTIWIGVILHGLMDLVSTTSVSSVFSQTPNLFETGFMLIIAGIEISCAILLLLSKSNQPAFRQTMNRIKIS